MERIGIIGLGRMGSAMAQRLALEGFAVSGWTRSGIMRDPAEALGITAQPDIASLAAASDIVILSLMDDAAVSAILSELVTLDLSGKLVVETSTVSPDTLRGFAAPLSAAGATAIDAPIAGGPGMILDGKVGLYIGGDDRDVHRFRPVAEKLSDRILHVGRLGDGAAAKLVNNMMLLGYWQCLKEALQLGRQAGLELETMIGILSGSPAASGAFKARIPVILGETDDVGFSVAGAVKDAHVVQALAEKMKLPVPAMAAALASFEAVIEKGHGEADLATMTRLAAEEF